MGKRLYVGNLSYDTSEDMLLSTFSQDGRSVESVQIMIDRDTGRSRGFAFVEMSSEEDARTAIESVDGLELDGRRLRVNEAQERPQRGGGGGGRRGRGDW